MRGRFARFLQYLKRNIQTDWRTVLSDLTRESHLNPDDWRSPFASPVSLQSRGDLVVQLHVHQFFSFRSNPHERIVSGGMRFSHSLPNQYRNTSALPFIFSIPRSKLVSLVSYVKRMTAHNADLLLEIQLTDALSELRSKSFEFIFGTV